MIEIRINTLSLVVVFINLICFVIGQDIVKIFDKCHINSIEFETCMKQAFNDLRPYFKSGAPQYNIAPFDPHRSPYVEQRRGVYRGVIGGYQLVLTDVFEYGWTNSEVTSFKLDRENNRIIYAQDFPVKTLNGMYDFRATVFGKPIHNKGIWNMTLYDYAQTTTVTRIGGPGGLLKVRVEIDKLGDLDLHITHLFNGKLIIEKLADFLINNVWQPGFPFLKPLINDLVSSAFTDIFNESFRKLPIDEIIKD